MSTGLLLPAYTGAPRLLGHGIKGQKFSVLRGWKIYEYAGYTKAGMSMAIKQTNKKLKKKKKGALDWQPVTAKHLHLVLVLLFP